MHLSLFTTTFLSVLSLSNASCLSKRQDLTGTSISAIGNARISAFDSASFAFVAATLLPNSIICPGVIGAAATPSEAPGDDVRLRTDPSAVSLLEQRQSIRPHESRIGNRRTKRHSTQTTPPVEPAVASATDVAKAS
ncbi:hypothetical protein KCU81_g1092, partial [Aureobasidium melanogenum]|uniref:Uncharacterized protein n=1 Tax=Aureobasidium melanogenum (strain CBS 110374) TaxID=1043003 RepID=A0A074W566_AURM1